MLSLLKYWLKNDLYNLYVCSVGSKRDELSADFDYAPAHIKAPKAIF